MSESFQLEGFPVTLRLDVQWGDQDAFAHVNNTVYFRWFESSRIEYFRRISMASRKEDQLGPILAAISCDYREALEYPDVVHVGASVTRMGNSSLGMKHVVYSEALGKVAAEGDSTIVCYHYGDKRSQPLPAELRRAIEELEARTSGE